MSADGAGDVSEQETEGRIEVQGATQPVPNSKVPHR